MHEYKSGSEFSRKITEGLGAERFYSGHALGREDKRYSRLPNPNVMRFKQGSQEQYQIWLSQVITKGLLFNATMIDGVIEGLDLACSQLQGVRENKELCDRQLQIS